MTKSEKCQEIIHRYYNGDKDAINELVDNIEGMLKSIVKKFLKGQEFDDLYQVAWLTVMKCVQLYDINSDTKFTSYVYRAVENDLVLYTRKQNKFKSKYDDKGNCIIGFIPMDSQVSNKMYEGTSVTVAETIADEKQNVEHESLVNTLRPLVYDIVHSFKNENQHEILLMYMQGIKQLDIAEELDVTPAYVSKTIKVFNEKCQLKLNM